MLDDMQLNEVRGKLKTWGSWLRDSDLQANTGKTERIGYAKPYRINLLRKKLITAKGKEKRKHKAKVPARDIEAERIDLAVCKLSQCQQNWIKSKYFYKITNEDAAAFYAISVSTYRRNLFEAYEKLYSYLLK